MFQIMLYNRCGYAIIGNRIVHYSTCCLNLVNFTGHGIKTFVDIELVVRASAKVVSRKGYGCRKTSLAAGFLYLVARDTAQ